MGKPSGPDTPSPDDPPPAATPSPPPPTDPSPPVAEVPGPARGRKLSGFLAGCLIVIGLLGVAGFLGWRWLDREFLSPPPTTTPDLFAFEERPPGPCYDLDVEDGFLAGWTDVSCDGPREAEVSFASSLLEGGAFPGDDFLASEAAERCRVAFEQYVGLPPEESIYDVDWLAPTEELWDGGARQTICLVITEDGSPLTGTVKGSNT